MYSNWFDYSRPTIYDYTGSRLKNPTPTLYPLKQAYISDFLQWICLWCKESPAITLFEGDNPLPLDLLGMCCYNHKNFYIRTNRHYCKYFNPINEYLGLTKTRRMLIELKCLKEIFLL